MVVGTVVEVVDCIVEQVVGTEVLVVVAGIGVLVSAGLVYSVVAHLARVRRGWLRWWPDVGSRHAVIG